MAFQHRLQGASLVCRPEGDMDEDTALGIAELVGSQSPRAVVVDLAGVPYLSSQGVGILLNLQNRLASEKRGFSLAAPSPLVRRILHQAGIAGVMTIHPSVEAAGGEAPPSAKAESPGG